MKILVCGSRSWTNADKILEVFDEFMTVRITIIHGAAKGADYLAGEYAEMMGWEVQKFPADWEKYGRLAGPKRNIQMLDERPDLVLAFWDGKSRGTKHTIDQAQKRGIPTRIITMEGK